jgi:hypothetical protein
MRKSSWIFLVVLFMAIGAPNAHADSFDFTVTGATSGSGTLTTNPPSGGTFLVTGITGVFGDPSLGNSSPITSLVAPGTGPFSNTNLIPLDASGLSFFTENNTEWTILFSDEFIVNEIEMTITGPIEDTLTPITFTVVATPEPSSVALMLAGIGLVFVMRKRIGQSLPQPS